MSKFSVGVITSSFAWHVFTPAVYRYLTNHEYAEAFFTDGSLRLASLQQFRKHEDEKRIDVSEGWASYFNVTEERGGQTFFGWFGFGHNGYVLCASARSDTDIRSRFGNNYIEITDTIAFAIEVAKQITGFIEGYEGPCRYVDMKSIETDLGYFDLEAMKNGKGEVKAEQLTQPAFATMQHWPAFMKHTSFMMELEYRFLWLTKEPIHPYIDIKVPDAIQFCKQRPKPRL